jgi:hypothetical protein
MIVTCEVEGAAGCQAVRPAPPEVVGLSFSPTVRRNAGVAAARASGAVSAPFWPAVAEVSPTIRSALPVAALPVVAGARLSGGSP